MLISLTSDKDLAKKAQDNGNDILFTNDDGTTKLVHEIEVFDGKKGGLIAWVKVPLLSSTQDTRLYMYYGNPECKSQQNPSEVWDNYMLVQHLEESCAAANCIKDSTTNKNDGTPYSGETITNLYTASGKINGAEEFDGLDDYVDCGKKVSLNFVATESYTWEGWLRPDKLRD